MQLSLTNPNQAAIHLTWQMLGDLSMHESLASELVLGCDGQHSSATWHPRNVAPKPVRVSEWDAFCDLSSKEGINEIGSLADPHSLQLRQDPAGLPATGTGWTRRGLCPEKPDRAFSLEWLQSRDTQSGLEQHRHGSSGWSEK